jgi:hypothetical protein
MSHLWTRGLSPWRQFTDHLAVASSTTNGTSLTFTEIADALIFVRIHGSAIGAWRTTGEFLAVSRQHP